MILNKIILSFSLSSLSILTRISCIEKKIKKKFEAPNLNLQFRGNRATTLDNVSEARALFGWEEEKSGFYYG